MRSWLSVLLVAGVCAAAAVLRGAGPAGAAACGALGAALAQAVRAFNGAGLAADVLAAAAGVLAVLGLDALVADPAREALAAAAAMWTIAELVRPLPARGSPLPALAMAACAGALDPAYVALVPLAGTRLATWPGHARWAIAAPIVGLVACALAIAAALAHGGVLARLWLAWAGTGTHGAGASRALAVAGDALGPIVALAALAGLAAGAARGRLAAATLLAAALGALALALRTGALAPAVPVVAALAASLGFARLAALVRHPTGRAAVAATCGLLAVVSAL
ncbi:MAG TPA: hypothetical protein VGF94_24440 [Kofleriaceae bacterium]|jgi:hypothetical protein